MSPPRFDVVVARSIREIEAHLPAWWELHEVRLEDNVFCSPAFLPEICRHCDSELNVAFVYRVSCADRTLIAVAAFASPRRRNGLASLSSCSSNFVYSSTPMLHRDLAAEAAEALWDWLDQPAWSTVCWDNLEFDSTAWRLIRQQLDERCRRWGVRYEFKRPSMSRGSIDADWSTSLSPRTRSQHRRSRRRLEAAGGVEIRLHRNLEDPNLIPGFLELEAQGWKGRGGTALAANPAHVDFFNALTRTLAERNELFFVEVKVDAEPVSITANLVDGTTVFGFKIAHSPAFAGASPGIFNTLEVMRLVQDDPVMTAADSGTGGDSCLLRYWPDFRPVGTIVAATRGFAGAAALSTLAATQWTRRTARRFLGRLDPAHGSATA